MEAQGRDANLVLAQAQGKSPPPHLTFDADLVINPGTPFGTYVQQLSSAVAQIGSSQRETVHRLSTKPL